MCLSKTWESTNPVRLPLSFVNLSGLLVLNEVSLFPYEFTGGNFGGIKDISFVNWTQELIPTGDVAQALLTPAAGKLENSDLMIM